MCARKNGSLRRRRPASTPRVGMLCLVLAAASLVMPASSAAGAGLSSAATVQAKKREAQATTEMETSSVRSSARLLKDDHDHDPRARASPVSRRRRYARPGEEGGSRHAGSGGSAGPRNRGTSSNSPDGRATPSSFDVLDSEEAGEGTSWGGTDSTGDSSDDTQGDDTSSGSSSSSCENYDTEEGLYGEGTEDEEDEGGLVGAALGGEGNSSEGEDELSDSDEEEDNDNSGDHDGEGKDGLSPRHREGRQRIPRGQEQAGRQKGSDDNNSVEVCVVTWNLAEESPPARDVEFLRHASRGSDIVAVGVQEIENLKPRRNEGGRTREWRRLLIRWEGRGDADCEGFGVV